MSIKSLSCLVVSVYGPHAGEDEAVILQRKMDDIRKVGFTMWYYSKGNKYARPLDVQNQAKIHQNQTGTPLSLYLIHPSVHGGAQATSLMPRQMKEFSVDGRKYTSVDHRIGPVTGGNDGFAFIISKIDFTENASIDLSRYADADNGNVQFKIGNSTQIVQIPQAVTSGFPMKRPIRKIWAACELAEPYCVFVR